MGLSRWSTYISVLLFCYNALHAGWIYYLILYIVWEVSPEVITIYTGVQTYMMMIIFGELGLETPPHAVIKKKNVSSTSPKDVHSLACIYYNSSSCFTQLSMLPSFFSIYFEQLYTSSHRCEVVWCLLINTVFARYIWC